jgi:CHRD domain
VVRSIRTNPSGFYANLHNVEFPAGAIRGQLSHFGD